MIKSQTTKYKFQINSKKEKSNNQTFHQITKTALRILEFFYLWFIYYLIF